RGRPPGRPPAAVGPACARARHRAGRGAPGQRAVEEGQAPAEPRAATGTARLARRRVTASRPARGGWPAGGRWGRMLGMPTHVALLRGINVGGNNKVAMADLRDVVASLGHTRVSTYIQSGNVLFTARKGAAQASALAAELERAIEQAFGLRLG